MAIASPSAVKGRQLQQNYQNFPKPPKPRLREYKVPAPHQKRPGPPGDPWHFAKAPPPDNKEERFWRCLALGPNPRAGEVVAAITLVRTAVLLLELQPPNGCSRVAAALSLFGRAALQRSPFP